MDFASYVGKPVMVKREYGPFLDKPNLPAGEYKIVRYGLSSCNTGLPKLGSHYLSGIVVSNRGHQYYLLEQDVELI